MYSIGQLSKKTAVTIRTLRYYDELGILKPSLIAESGYRYYNQDDVIELQHIIALKNLGFTLSQIKDVLLERTDCSKEERWQSALRRQIAAVEEEKKRLQYMEKLLNTTLHAIEMTGEFHVEDIFLFIQALQSDPRIRREWLRQNFSQEEISILTQLPELGNQDENTQIWVQLLRDIREHQHEAADSPIAYQLAHRLVLCTNTFFQGNEELCDRYWNMIRPQPDEQAKVYGLDRETMAYIERIVEHYLCSQEIHDQQ